MITTMPALFTFNPAKAAAYAAKWFNDKADYRLPADWTPRCPGDTTLLQWLLDDARPAGVFTSLVPDAEINIEVTGHATGMLYQWNAAVTANLAFTSNGWAELSTIGDDSTGPAAIVAYLSEATAAVNKLAAQAAAVIPVIFPG